MKTFLLTIIIGALYGVYDLFIKLSADKATSVMGALITQLFSVVLILAFIIYQLVITKSLQLKLTAQGIFFSGIAGILIGSALLLLFVQLQTKGARATSILPMILVFRNVTFISLGILILREEFTFSKTIGVVLSLLGIYLLY